MAGDTRFFGIHSVLLCLVSGYGVAGTILQGPSNVTVLSGSDATFQCKVAPTWSAITWIYQGVQIVSISPREVTVDPNQNIVVQNFTNIITGEFTSIVTFINVQKSNSGRIQCFSLSSTNQEAFLSVQVKGSLDIAKTSLSVTINTTVDVSCGAVGWSPIPIMTWVLNNTAASSSEYTTTSTEIQGGLYNVNSILKLTPVGNTRVTCIARIETTQQNSTVNITVTAAAAAASSTYDRTTVIIAVTVTLGCILLIVLIIVVVVCCCRKEKQREMSYQSTAWGASAKNSNEQTYKDYNFEYEPDISEVQRPLPSLPSLIYSSVSAPYTVTLDKDSFSQAPEKGWNDTFLRKIRHVTHV